MAIFILTLIIIIVIAVLCIHFLQEQEKLISKNNYEVATDTIPKIKKTQTRNKLTTLILLSITSACILASLSLLVFENDGSLNAFSLFALIDIVRTQLIMIIPVTLGVYFIYYLIYKGNHSVNIIYRIIIPLIFNLIGGSIILIITGSVLTGPALVSFIQRDVIVTIKNEAFIPSTQQGVPSIYKIVLNVNNPSQMEISKIGFSLATSKYHDSKNPSIAGLLGYVNTDEIISTGESDIVVDLPIYVVESSPECTDGSLDKPLYLFYMIDYLNTKSLVVSNSINQKILEINCKQIP